MDGMIPAAFCGCGRRLARRRTRARGTCYECHQLDRRIVPGQDEDLTGKARERALSEHAAWLEHNPGPWDRATGGLRMFVVDNGRGYWP